MNNSRVEVLCVFRKRNIAKELFYFGALEERVKVFQKAILYEV
jgi:hypothetical protein